MSWLSPNTFALPCGGGDTPEGVVFAPVVMSVGVGTFSDEELPQLYQSASAGQLNNDSSGWSGSISLLLDASADTTLTLEVQLTDGTESVTLGTIGPVRVREEASNTTLTYTFYRSHSGALTAGAAVTMELYVVANGAPIGVVSGLITLRQVRQLPS